MIRRRNQKLIKAIEAASTKQDAFYFLSLLDASIARNEQDRREERSEDDEQRRSIRDDQFFAELEKCKTPEDVEKFCERHDIELYDPLKQPHDDSRTPERRLDILRLFVDEVLTRNRMPGEALVAEVAWMLRHVPDLPLQRDPQLRKGAVSRVMGLSDGWGRSLADDKRYNKVTAIAMEGLLLGTKKAAMVQQVAEELFLSVEGARYQLDKALEELSKPVTLDTLAQYESYTEQLQIRGMSPDESLLEEADLARLRARLAGERDK